MYAMSINEITKLAISVLAFQKIFHFIHRYWCCELDSIKAEVTNMRPAKHSGETSSLVLLVSP